MDAKPKTQAQKTKAFHEELIIQMSTLVTSGFGVVAALAWNEAIQSFVKSYVEPKIPGSGIFYQFLYAILVTFLIVLVTYQLSKISAKIQARSEEK